MKFLRKISKLFPSRFGRVLAFWYFLVFCLSLILIMSPQACSNKFGLPCSVLDLILLPVMLLMLLLWKAFDPLFDLLNIRIIGLPAQIPWILAVLLWMVLLYFLGVLIEKKYKNKKKSQKGTSKPKH